MAKGSGGARGGLQGLGCCTQAQAGTEQPPVPLPSPHWDVPSAARPHGAGNGFHSCSPSQRGAVSPWGRPMEEIPASSFSCRARGHAQHPWMVRTTHAGLGA